MLLNIVNETPTLNISTKATHANMAPVHKHTATRNNLTQPSIIQSSCEFGMFYFLGTVVNLVLLKCRKLRREDQETSDWISRILLLRTQAVVNCSHRNLNPKQSYMVSYRQNRRRDFLEVETNIKCIDTNPINLAIPRLGQKAICRTVVWLIELTLIIETKAQLSQAQWSGNDLKHLNCLTLS